MVTIAYAPPAARHEVAQFMDASFPRAKWGFDKWQALLAGRWGDDRDNFAITVRDGSRLVGALGLVTANRLTSAGWAKTANMTSWYVLKELRGQGIGRQMLDLVTADPAIAITNFSSAKAAVPLIEKAGFRVLDDHRNIWQPRTDAQPLPLLSDPAILTDRDRRVLNDHAGLNLKNSVVATPDGPCMLVLSIKQKHDDYMTHEVMYLGNPGAFALHARRIADSVLPRKDAVLSVDQRFLPTDFGSDIRTRIEVPRYYFPSKIAAREIDNLYSEIVLLDLKLY